MSISPAVAEYAAIAESRTGRKPTEQGLRVIEAVYQVGLQLANTGLRDAQEGRKPLQIEAFAGIVDKMFGEVFGADFEITQEIVALLHENYIIGFSSQRDTLVAGCTNSRQKPHG